MNQCESCIQNNNNNNKVIKRKKQKKERESMGERALEREFIIIIFSFLLSRIYENRIVGFCRN